MSFDVIVIGAGSAGITAAFHIAKAGNKVLLVDKAEEKEIGRGLGGGVVKIHAFSGAGFPRPQGDELVSYIETFNIYSPTAKTKKTVNYSSMIIDKYLMTQRLLGYAKEQGVTVLAGKELKLLNVQDDKVTGITTTDQQSFDAKLVIDASGVNSLARRTLPDSFKIEKEIDNKHIARGYLEMLPKVEDTNYLNSYLAVSDGYIWKTATEIGFGSLDHSIDLKARLHAFIDEHIHLKTDSSRSYYGTIPIRQNLYNMVGNGYLAVGDSACMISPIEGAGITTSMAGAKIAADVVNKCLSRNDLSENALWSFNLEYNKTQGSQLAYMDMLRRGVIGLSPDDIDFAFKQDVIMDKDVLDSITGDIANVSTMDKASRVFRGIRRPGILLRMENCMSKSKDLKNHYLNYPTNISGLDEWVKKLNTINNSFS
ncbi:MAG: NAD(P)/FAD-dependent oxidoreductase [Candidatus Sericytochromatia bacterium]|nr:NAD(P)/FAD-dependent oxidoreductase [Candidatus Sericytochromatia bacterium]